MEATAGLGIRRLARNAPNSPPRPTSGQARTARKTGLAQVLRPADHGLAQDLGRAPSDLLVGSLGSFPDPTWTAGPRAIGSLRLRNNVPL